MLLDLISSRMTSTNNVIVTYIPLLFKTLTIRKNRPWVRFDDNKLRLKL